MKLPFTKDFTQEQHNRVLPQILVVAFAITFTALIIYFERVWDFISKVISLATPFFLGFGLAYLLGPMMHKIEWLFERFVFKNGKRKKLTRALSIVLAMAAFLSIVCLILVFMVPELVNSIQSAVNYITNYLRTNALQLEQLLSRVNGYFAEDIFVFEGEQLLFAWESIVATLLGNINSLVGNIFDISSAIFSTLLDLLVGIITAFYILMDKERIAAQIKKMGYSLVARDRFEELIFWTRRANRIFKGFIIGKIIDSAIIGVICYLCMLIFKMEYALLISIVIGVTNVIPFFGPFIGWGPCALLLLMVNPISALWFSLFILVLQQLDGNVIGPFILGDYVGVSALSIMIAIVIGGGLFGFVGMLVSVPVYALVYAIFRSFMHTRLRRRNLPTETERYIIAPEGLPAQEAGEEA